MESNDPIVSSVRGCFNVVDVVIVVVVIVVIVVGEKGLIQFRGQATFVSANFQSHFKAAAVFRFLFGPTDDFEQRRGACGMFSTRAEPNKL